MTDPTSRLDHLALPRGNYAHYRRAGDFIYVSGLSSRRADNWIAGAVSDASGTARLDIRAQTRAVIEKLATVLAAASASLAEIVVLDIAKDEIAAPGIPNAAVMPSFSITSA